MHTHGGGAVWRHDGVNDRNKGGGTVWRHDGVDDRNNKDYGDIFYELLGAVHWQ
jgi:hypothetical protein